jgi:magnesium chelatase subunit I
VSVRLTITLVENLVSNLERRALKTGETTVYARVCDFPTALSAVTGKIELVYEGEQEGITSVARHIAGKAFRTVFLRRFPGVYDESKRARRRRPAVEPGRVPTADDDRPSEDSPYKRITDWYAGGNTIEISDDTPFDAYFAELCRVDGLREMVEAHARPASDGELAGLMELVLEGLHQSNQLGKEDLDGAATYSDMLGRMFSQLDA